MKQPLTVALCALTIAAFAAPAHAREFSRSQEPTPTRSSGTTVSLDAGLSTRGLNATVAPSTTWLGSWGFDGSGSSCDAEGWIGYDPRDMPPFAHIDDFAGLGGGSFGVLVPLEGAQSMWLGARPSSSDLTLCQYLALPGYGNSWNQGWCTASCLGVTGDVAVDYIINYYTEPGYDIIYTEFDTCDGNYTSMRQISGYPNRSVLSDVIPAASHSGDVGVRFFFRSDAAWSDEDGLWDTDGAFIIDSVTVSDATGIVLSTELFEDETPGDQTTVSGAWTACVEPWYGDFSGLFPGTSVLQEDPCTSTASCIWGFFSGSTYNYGCGGFPSQAAVPYGNAADQYIYNLIESPMVPITGTGASFELSFDVYRDLPLAQDVFYVWDVRFIGPSGCPGKWLSRNIVYFGQERAWVHDVFPIGDLVDPGATHLQVRLGVRDMCGFWCGPTVPGDCHSHAPLLDNVGVYRVASDGPQWAVPDANLFQDTFAADGTTTGTARADAAIDILPASNPGILPGDSVALQVSDPDNSLAADIYTGFGSAVYLYVGVWPQGQPGKTGGGLTQDSFRWPVVDSLTSGGDTWYCLRMDTTFTDGAARTGAAVNGFCVDLNDNLFTPGDTICFFFCAESNLTGKRTYWTEFTGTTTDLAEALANPSEFQILPGGGWAAGGDMLYVDGYDGFGAQPFFDTAFQSMRMDGLVDRYDIRAPSSHVGNRPGARVKDVYQQIIGAYRGIFWNTGDLKNGLIGDGTGSPEKSDDAGMLFTFIDNLPNTGGIYFSGDNIAEEWTHLGGAAVNLRNFITHNVVSGDHVAAGYGTSPYAVGTLYGCFGHAGVGDTLVAFGGCPSINDFDVIEPTGTATLAMTYNGVGSSTSGAVIAQRTMNNAGFDVGVVLSGFSYHSIRDDRPNGNVVGTLDRFEHLYDIHICMLGTTWTPSDAPDKTASRFQLDQNFPNPFNPTTTIQYQVKETGNVTLRIYNVAGQLVRTLVNEPKAAGVTHVAEWNGRNDAGVAVSSGVYFYKLTASNWTQTKKMVLLK